MVVGQVVVDGALRGLERACRLLRGGIRCSFRGRPGCRFVGGDTDALSCSTQGDRDNRTVIGKSFGGIETVIVGGRCIGGRVFRYDGPVAERVLSPNRWWLWVGGFSGHGVWLLVVLAGMSAGQAGGGSCDADGGSVEMCVEWKESEKEKSCWCGPLNGRH